MGNLVEKINPSSLLGQRWNFPQKEDNVKATDEDFFNSIERFMSKDDRRKRPEFDKDGNFLNAHSATESMEEIALTQAFKNLKTQIQLSKLIIENFSNDTERDKLKNTVLSELDEFRWFVIKEFSDNPEEQLRLF